MDYLPITLFLLGIFIYSMFYNKYTNYRCINYPHVHTSFHPFLNFFNIPSRIVSRPYYYDIRGPPNVIYTVDEYGNMIHVGFKHNDGLYTVDGDYIETL